MSYSLQSLHKRNQLASSILSDHDIDMVLGSETLCHLNHTKVLEKILGGSRVFVGHCNCLK